MKQRALGKSGLTVSVVGLGGNNFGGRLDLEASRAVIHKALDLGVTLFDTADVYPMTKPGDSEEYLAKILGNRRKDVILATKFGHARDDRTPPPGASRRFIMSAIEASLQRLKTDWIDLYQVHQPDPGTPIEETLRALDDLIKQGKVRYIGCSNFHSWQLVDALWTSRHLGLSAFAACQDEYSLLARNIERELLPAMQAHGVGLLPYFPLASGLLTGKYKRNAPLPEGARLTYTQGLSNRFLTEANWQLVDNLEKFCTARGHSLLELAFSWLLARPAVASVVAGSSTPEQLEQNVRATDWMLAPEDMAEIDRLIGKGIGATN
jgi:aryl-alcohol dehydrogenase-like predicted oxidoreductase